MKKTMFFVLILAAVTVCWLKRQKLRPTTITPVESVRPIDVNEKVRRLPPHLQRKVIDALGEAGRFGASTAEIDTHFSERMPHVRQGAHSQADSPAYSPELQQKLDQLPPSTRRKVERSLDEARKNRLQPD